jgi:hypothetical protein
MSGFAGSSISNFPIPPVLLEEQHRDFATVVFLREPIADYEELMRSNSTTFKLEWPSNLVFYYQDKIVTENGCHLTQAWQIVGRNSFAQIFDAVKNRTLGMALELQSSLGADLPADKITAQVAASIERTVTNNIYGGINVIASGASNVSSSVSQTNQGLRATDIAQLTHVLREGGLSENEVGELSKAIEEDAPQRFGKRTSEWVKTTGSKLLVGGIKVSSAVAQSVITEYLKQHFGLTT